MEIMANIVIENIVKRYLSKLSLKELADLVNSTTPSNILLTFGDSTPPGDVRTVELPDINAVSDFDELMESFRNVHSLTKITGA